MESAGAAALPRRAPRLRLIALSVFIALVSLLSDPASLLPRGWKDNPLVSSLSLAEAEAAIAFVKNIGTNSDSGGTTSMAVTVPAAGVAAGNSVIITLATDYTTNPVTCSDSRGNTYTINADRGYSSYARVVVCSAHNITALSSGDTITVNYPSTNLAAVSINEFSGLADSSTLDKTSTATGTSSSPSSGSTATTTQADELLIGAFALDGPVSDTFTPGASYTLLTRRGASYSSMGTTYITIDPEYRIVSATGAYAADGSNSSSRHWAAAIATYKAALYRPDSLIKKSSEDDTAYIINGVYETTAVEQVKSQGVVNTNAAAYNIKFQNDGNSTDSFVITGTAGGSGFTVQYLDDGSTDRTSAVTGAGYTISSLAAGATKVWTVNVTPSASTTGGTSYNVFVTAESVKDGTKTDQVKAVTTSISANITLLKSRDKATANPGEDITYSVTATNGSGLSNASNVVVTDPVPTNTGFKVGGATFNAGTSTLSAALSYSNNGGSTWTYTPTSGGCSAPAGYDYCATDVKWTMTGGMPTGTNFSIGLVVRVK